MLDVAQLAGGVLDEIVRLLEGGGQGLDDELGELLRDLLGRLRDEPEEEVGAPRRLELAPDAAQGSGPVGRGQEREHRAQSVGVGLAELVEQRADRLGLDHLAADLSRKLREDGDVLGVGLGVLQHASHEVPPQGQARLRVHGAEHRGDALLELVLVGLVLEVEPQPLPRDGQQELRVVRGARPGEEHGHAARLLLLDAAEVDAPEERAEPVDVAARVEGERPAHGGIERHPGAGVGAAGRAAAEARHQALPRLLRCPAAVHQPATGGEAAPLHAGDERLLDQLLVAGELPEEPFVHRLGGGLVAGGERDPSHDPGARGEARVIGEPGGFGLVAGRAIRGRGLARRAQVLLDGADLAGEELRDGRVVGERREDPLEDALDRLIELVDVAGEVEGLVVLLVRAALVERLAGQEDVERAPVERERRGVVSQGLGQLPHLREESHVRGARGEDGLVALEGALDEPGLLEALRGLRLVQLAVGELAGQVEGARGRPLVPLLQEGVPEVEVDLGRDELAEPHQAAAEGQLLAAVPITRGHAEGAARGLGEVHQLAQHRGPARPGGGKAVLQGRDLPIVVLRLLGEVGEELVEVGPVLLRREALEGHAPRPLDHLRPRRRVDQHVEQAVDRDGEEIVALGGLREVLEHPDGEVRLADLLEEVRHQQVAVDALGVRGQPAAVRGDRLRAHPRERQHAGLELGRAVVAARQLLQTHQRGPRLVRLAALELAHRELPVVVRPALGVEGHEARDGLLVVVVVVAGEIDARLLRERLQLRAAGAAQELVDDLRRADGVADLRVEADE